MNSPAVQQIIAELAAIVGDQAGLDGTVKFDFGDAGSVLIDGKARNSVSDGTGKSADTTLSLSLEDFSRIVRKEVDPTQAYLQGMLQIEGDIGLATKLDPLLQKARA